MTGLFQKVNHLGKFELIGSADYVIGKDKKYYFSSFPKVNKLHIFKWGKKTKQKGKDPKFNNYNIIRKN